MPSSIKNILTH